MPVKIAILIFAEVIYIYHSIDICHMQHSLTVRYNIILQLSYFIIVYNN